MEKENRIIENQNNQSILDKLSAQRNLYSKAKLWRNSRFIVCVLSILVLSVLKAFMTDNREIAIALLFTVFVTLLLGPFFNKQINKKRDLAARIQQLLDIELYGLTWDDILCGGKPTEDDVYDYKSETIPENLYDWYDKGISEVRDLNTAILLCQRENLRYDSHIRNSFNKICKWIAFFVCVGILIAGVIINWNDLLSIIVFGLIPITPVVRWIQSVDSENSKDKTVREGLESLVTKGMEKAMKGKSITEKELILIQNYLFIHRRDGYLVPDWYYLICREDSEARAAYSVKDFLRQYRSKQ